MGVRGESVGGGADDVGALVVEGGEERGVHAAGGCGCAGACGRCCGLKAALREDAQRVDADDFLLGLQGGEHDWLIQRASSLQEPENGNHHVGVADLGTGVLETAGGLMQRPSVGHLRLKGEFLTGQGAAGGVGRFEFADEFVAARAREVGERGVHAASAFVALGRCGR